MKKCPYCAEEVQDEAIKCKHCAEMLNQLDDYDAKEGEIKQISTQQWWGVSLFLLASLVVVGWSLGQGDSKGVLYAIWLSVFGILQLLLVFASKYIKEQ